MKGKMSKDLVKKGEISGERIITNLLIEFNLKSKDKILEFATKIDSVNEGGIYFLIKNSKIIYIGESENLMRRIAEHINSSEINFDSFAILATENNRATRNKLERLYINKFNPWYNKKPQMDLMYMSVYKSEINQILRGIDYKIWYNDNLFYSIQ